MKIKITWGEYGKRKLRVGYTKRRQGRLISEDIFFLVFTLGRDELCNERLLSSQHVTRLLRESKSSGFNLFRACASDSKQLDGLNVVLAVET